MKVKLLLLHVVLLLSRELVSTKLNNSFSNPQVIVNKLMNLYVLTSCFHCLYIPAQSKSSQKLKHIPALSFFNTFTITLLCSSVSSHVCATSVPTPPLRPTSYTVLHGGSTVPSYTVLHGGSTVPPHRTAGYTGPVTCSYSAHVVRIH